MSSFESFAFFMAPLSDHCAIGRAITKRPRIILHTTTLAKISFRLTYNYWMCLLEIFAIRQKIVINNYPKVTSTEGPCLTPGMQQSLEIWGGGR